MKKITSVLLLAGALGLAAANDANAQQAPDSTGRTTGPAALLALSASPATACLQLHLGATVFNFNMTIKSPGDRSPARFAEHLGR